MSVKQSFLVLLFLSLLTGVFSACERSRGIGFNLVPQSEVGLFFTDTLSVEASTVLTDSVLTRNNANLLFGSYLDPVLGKVTVKSFVQFAPQTASVNDSIKLDKTNISGALQFDSLTLNLRFVYDYGDKNLPQELHLYRVTDTISTSYNYVNYSTVSTQRDPLAVIPIKGSDISKTGFLTINFKNYPGLATLANEIFQLADNKTSFKAFLEAFKGLAFLPGPNDNAAVLGIEGNLSNLFTRMTIHYRKTETSGDVKNLTYPFFLRSWFNNFQSQRNATILQNLDQPLEGIKAKDLNDLSFIQGGIGIYTKFEFPSLERLKNLGNVVLNKVELVIKPQFNSTDVYTVPRLFLLQTDNSNRILTQISNGFKVPLYVAPDNQSINQLESIGFNSRDLEYRIPLTGYFQGLFSGDIKNKALLVIPGNGENSVNRLIINNKKGSPFSVKLRVYYTQFLEE